MKFHRNGWIGPEALELFQQHPEACEGKHDQGALNYVAGSALILVSNRWNFPKQFLHLVNLSFLIHRPLHGASKAMAWDFLSVERSRKSSLPRLAKICTALYNRLYRGLTFDRLVLYKYRSILEQIKHGLTSDQSKPHLQPLLVGDYAL